MNCFLQILYLFIIINLNMEIESEMIANTIGDDKDKMRLEITNDTMSSISNKIDDEYKSFTDSIEFYENNIHYSGLMCMKDIKGPKYKDLYDKFIINSKKMTERKNLKYKCVLHVGHTGKCCKNFNSLFKKNKFNDKLKGSIDLAVYSTPGNDDYVYKNRCSRLFENVLSSKEEKKKRDKNEKKKCAIPLKDASSPILLNQAYLDWMTYIVNIKGMSDYLIHDETTKNIWAIINKNKEHLISVFGKDNRKVFNSDGYSICAITQNLIKPIDVSDPTRDNRKDILDTDIQLGHNYPRSEKYVSIRGENLIPMSRRGNLIIGERVFTQDIWIDELKQIINKY